MVVNLMTKKLQR
jgi:DNA repair exonuclease SbcCD ATPase subunit